MRVEIYEPPKPEPEPEPEQVIRLALRPAQYGPSIELVAVDARGKRLNQGTLCGIDAKGIHRSLCVGENLGFDLDDGNRLIVTDE